MSEHAPSARDLAAASLRDLTTRYLDLLDTGIRDRLEGQAVAADQALERLAVSEAISRYVRNGRQVDILAALNSGASWRDVADVLDAPKDQLREEFRRWVDGQRKHLRCPAAGEARVGAARLEPGAWPGSAVAGCVCRPRRARARRWPRVALLDVVGADLPPHERILDRALAVVDPRV